MDFAPVKDAGLTQSEFAKLAGVSRVTVNSWMRGKMNPHRYIADEVAALLRNIVGAVEGGDLPLADGIERHKRAAAIATALAPLS